jgi:hypothetical protein
MRHCLFSVILAGLAAALLAGCARPPGELAAAPDAPTASTAVVPRAEEVPVSEDAAFVGTDMDDAARYLAGLPGPRGSALTPFRERPEWAAHTRNLNELWRRFDTLRRWPIQSWGSREMGGIRSAGTVFYPFSGPDFLFADTFFPSARNYVLCGLESTEPLPPLSGMSDGQRADGLASLNTALTSSLSFSFFITKDMKADLKRSEFKGVLPVMLVFLARGGHTIHSVEAVSLDAGGQVTARSSGSPGFRIRFGEGRTLYYFTTDLSNGSFNDQSRFARFVKSLGPCVAFTKSASYLMHEDYFSNIRNFILGWCSAILQDDSGIPYRHLPPDRWDVRLYGRYSGVLGIFAKYYQPDLAEAEARGADPLGFGIGYKHNEGQSVMILARRR